MQKVETMNVLIRFHAAGKRAALQQERYPCTLSNSLSPS
jgi:hypothetical protein